MFYVVISHASSTRSEKVWMKVLGTLNEYQARLFVAERAIRPGTRRDQSSGSSDGNVTSDYYSGSERSQRHREVEKRVLGSCAESGRRAKEGGGRRSRVASPAQGDRGGEHGGRSDEPVEVDQQVDADHCPGIDPIGASGQ